jgi:hypothetical protein
MHLFNGLFFVTIHVARHFPVFQTTAIVIFFIVVLSYQLSRSMLWGLAILEFLLQLSSKHFLIVCKALLLIQQQKLSLLFFLTVPLAFLLMLTV